MNNNIGVSPKIDKNEEKKVQLDKNTVEQLKQYGMDIFNFLSENLNKRIQDLENKDRKIEELNESLNEKIQDLQNKDRKIKELNESLNEKNQEKKELENCIQSLKKETKLKENQNSEMVDCTNQNSSTKPVVRE